MKFQSSICLLALILSFSSCSMLRTSSTTTKTADFSKYKTFKMVRFYNEAQLEQKGIYLSEMDVRSIDNAVAGKVKNAGLRWSEGNDLLVLWTFGLDLKSNYSKQTQAGANAWGYYYNYGNYGSPTYTSVSERQIVKGKLSVALVDSKTKKLLWLGEGKKKMKVNVEDRDPEAVKAAVERIMSTFPYPIQE